MNRIDAQTLLVLMGKIATYVSFLPLIFSLIKIQAFRSKPYIYLSLYFATGALLNWSVSVFVEYSGKHYEEIAHILTKYEIDDTFFVDPVYFIRNFIFMGLYAYALVEKKSLKDTILIISATGILFTVLNSFWGETYKVYQAIGSSVDNAFKIFIGGIIYYWIFSKLPAKKLWKIPHYWFASAIITIGAFAGLIDFLSNYMFKEVSTVFYIVHIIKNCFMILAFILFTIGIYFVRIKGK
ncbi:hypothetical protein [Emticicia sp. BO119]|uniref:hypothetical protein n=1 Tax=Emticicia sp. BO119 TaxID=2757768 RepID=UPI0015F020AF|nr:hypothetical protein [Emticicia sp. BO119]MBA4848779.1 hypothetical protein [Emticicia sp. BO119]